MYIAFIGIFGYSFYSIGHVSLASEPAILNISLGNTKNNNDIHSFEVLIQNTSEKESARDIILTLLSDSNFHIVKPDTSQRYKIKENTVTFPDLASFQAYKGTLFFRSSKGNITLKPSLEYRSVGYRDIVKLSEIKFLD